MSVAEKKDLKSIRILMVVHPATPSKPKHMHFTRNMIINDNLNIEYLFTKSNHDQEYSFDALVKYIPSLKNKKTHYINNENTNANEKYRELCSNKDLVIFQVSLTDPIIRIINDLPCKILFISHCHYSLFINDNEKGTLNKKFKTYGSQMDFLTCCKYSKENTEKTNANIYFDGKYINKNDSNTHLIKFNSLPSFNFSKIIYNNPKFNLYKDYIVLLPGGSFKEQDIRTYTNIIRKVFKTEKILIKLKNFVNLDKCIIRDKNQKQNDEISTWKEDPNIFLFSRYNCLSYELLKCKLCICLQIGSSYFEGLNLQNEVMFTSDNDMLSEYEEFGPKGKLLISSDKNEFHKQLICVSKNKDYFDEEYNNDKKRLFDMIYGGQPSDFNEEFEKYLKVMYLQEKL